MAQGVRTAAVRKALQVAITSSGLSINEIARRLSAGGNRRSQVQKWKRGETGITVENAVRLEEALGIQDGWLVDLVRVEQVREATKRLEAQLEAKRALLHRRWSGDDGPQS